jgi:hypothetical protein
MVLSKFEGGKIFSKERVVSAGAGAGVVQLPGFEDRAWISRLRVRLGTLTDL